MGKSLCNSVILKGCKKIAFSVIQVRYLSFDTKPHYGRDCETTVIKLLRLIAIFSSCVDIFECFLMTKMCILTKPCVHNFTFLLWLHNWRCVVSVIETEWGLRKCVFLHLDLLLQENNTDFTLLWRGKKLHRIRLRPRVACFCWNLFK